MKITGAEFREWHDTAWPKGLIWDSDSVLDDGREIYKEDGTLIFTNDEIFTVPSEWRLAEEEVAGNYSDNYPSVRSLIRKWRVARGTMIIVVRVPTTDEDKAKTLVKAHGWSVVI